MHKYTLSLHEQKIVRLLSKALAERTDDAFSWDQQGGNIVLDHVPGFSVKASLKELQEIEASGLIRLRVEGGGAVVGGRLQPQAAEAVRGSFGVGRRQIVLQAIYEKARGHVGQVVSWEQIEEETGLDPGDVRSYVEKLVHDHQLQADGGGEGVSLNAAGLAGLGPQPATAKPAAAETRPAPTVRQRPAPVSAPQATPPRPKATMPARVAASDGSLLSKLRRWMGRTS